MSPLRQLRNLPRQPSPARAFLSHRFSRSMLKYSYVHNERESDEVLYHYRVGDCDYARL